MNMTKLIISYTASLIKTFKEIEALGKKMQLESPLNSRIGIISKRHLFWRWIWKMKRNDSRVQDLWKYFQKWVIQSETDTLPRCTQVTQLTERPFLWNYGHITWTGFKWCSTCRENIPLKVGFEFKVLRVYGVEDLVWWWYIRCRWSFSSRLRHAKNWIVYEVETGTYTVEYILLVQTVCVYFISIHWEVN